MKRSDIPTIAVLKACDSFHNGNAPAPLEALMDEFGAPENVVYAAMEREDDKGLIDYGVSLRTAFLTKKGYDYLEENL